MEDRRRGPRRLLVHVGHTWMPLPVGEWIIGRAPESDIRIDDDKVSRRHALVRAVPGGWELADDRSLNGIWLDGRQIQRMTIPPGGVTVLFGGRDGVPVRLLPDRAGRVPAPAGRPGSGDVAIGARPAPGTSPAGVRFEQVTPDWSARSPASPPSEGGETGRGLLRSFVRQATRLVGRRDPAD